MCVCVWVDLCTGDSESVVCLFVCYRQLIDDGEERWAGLLGWEDCMCVCVHGFMYGGV